MAAEVSFPVTVAGPHRILTGFPLDPIIQGPSFDQEHKFQVQVCQAVNFSIHATPAIPGTESYITVVTGVTFVVSLHLR